MGYTQKLGLLAQSVFQDSSLNVGIGAAPSGTYKFEVTGTAKVSSNLVTGGYALIGTTASTGVGASRLQVTGAATAQLLVSNTTSSGHIALYTTGVDAYITKNTASGNMYFGLAPQDGSSFTSQLSIASTGAATFSSNVVTSTYFNVNNSTRDFYINASADLGFGPLPTVQVASAHTLQFATNNTLRASILQDGQFLMNTAVALSAGWLCISVPSNNYNAIVLRDTGTSYSTGNYYQLFTNSSNTIAGSIAHVTATTVLYATSSDYRLKEDLKDFNGLDILSNIKFYDFKWKDEDIRMHGVIAHELQEIIPLMVSGTKDAINDEGNILSQGVDYSKLVPILGKAIQEMNTKLDEQNQTIQNLQEQNQDLKSRLDKAGL